MTSSARAGRGRGNGGKAYRESTFWDNIEEKAKKKRAEEEKRNDQAI